MTIHDLVSRYCESNDIGAEYSHQLECFARTMERTAGTASLECLRPDVVNQLINRSAGYSDDTRSNFRRRYLSLAKWAKKQGYIKKVKKKKVSAVRRKLKPPKGYSFLQAQQVISVVATPQPEWLSHTDDEWLATPMMTTKIIRRKWWYAFLLACWDTGHPTDMRYLKRHEIIGDVVYRSRGKTASSGRTIFCRLNPSTMASITQMEWTGEDVFPNWGGNRDWNAMWDDYRRIASLARVGGSLKWFRSGSGTDFESHYPGRGNELLANTRSVFEKQYLIKSHLKLDRVPKSRPLTG